MKRYGQFRNIFFTLDEYGDLFSLKEDEDHRRRYQQYHQESS